MRSASIVLSVIVVEGVGSASALEEQVRAISDFPRVSAAVVVWPQRAHSFSLTGKYAVSCTGRYRA